MKFIMTDMTMVTVFCLFNLSSVLIISVALVKMICIQVSDFYKMREMLSA